MTLKMAVFAPMPMASVATATLVKRGILARLRSNWFHRMAIDTAGTAECSASPLGLPRAGLANYEDRSEDAYESRSRTRGSVDIARSVGTRHAMNVTNETAIATAAKVAGSVALTS